MREASVSALSPTEITLEIAEPTLKGSAFSCRLSCAATLENEMTKSARANAAAASLLLRGTRAIIFGFLFKLISKCGAKLS
jgi:hypothetical protein